jgi:hypothetical protein
MSFIIQLGTTRSCPDTNLGPCRDFYRFVLWNLSVRITILSVRTVKSIGSYHNLIGSYRFVSHFYRAVLWNLSVRITILSGLLWNLSVCITNLSGSTVKSISSYSISIWPYCEIYRFVSQFYLAYCEIYWFVSQFYRAVLWNLSVRITFLSGRTLKFTSSYHNSIWSYCEIYLFVSQFYWFVLCLSYS